MEEDCIGCQGPQWTVVLQRETEKEEEEEEKTDCNIPYFSIDNAHLKYNAHPKLFRHSF